MIQNDALSFLSPSPSMGEGFEAMGAASFATDPH